MRFAAVFLPLLLGVGSAVPTARVLPAAAAASAASSILSEFRGEIGSRRTSTRSARYDVDDDSDLDSLMDDNDADTPTGLPHTGTFNSDDLISAGLSSAGLKQRRQGAVPDLEEGVPSPRQDGQLLRSTLCRLERLT